MTGTWTCFGVNWLHQRPQSVLQIVLVEVVHSVVAIVATKDVNAPPIHDSRVTISRRWGLRIGDWQNFCPQVVVEIKLKKVIAPVCAVISSENVEVILNAYRRVKRARTGRVSLVQLLTLNQVPRSRLFDSVFLTANIVLRVENVLMLTDSHNSSSVARRTRGA